jgi:5'-methylthioadenosine phosphorylase
MAQDVVRQILTRIPAERPADCLCASALAEALITERSLIPEETKRALQPLIGKYIPL